MTVLPVMSIGSRAKASSSLWTRVVCSVWSAIAGSGSAGPESGLSGPAKHTDYKHWLWSALKSHVMTTPAMTNELCEGWETKRLSLWSGSEYTAYKKQNSPYHTCKVGELTRLEVVKVILVISMVWRHHDALCDSWWVVKNTTPIFGAQQLVN